MLKKYQFYAGWIFFIYTLPLFYATTVESSGGIDRETTPGYPGVVFSLENIKQLARHPIWLKLLHYKDEQSQIESGDFFLSPAGRTDPEAELAATLAAYGEPWPEKANCHARCRFPARYWWLSQQINFSSAKKNESVPSQCQALSRWEVLKTTRSVSFVLVSGYLGNPASVFGHSLLRLNSNSDGGASSLFDKTINFGAVTPKNENLLRYAVYGLTGGYRAVFSDSYYYVQDMTYSRMEFRDLWEYELNLNENQRTLLLLHLWEILGKKFTYYFLSKNCAYRLAELLELVTNEPLLRHSSAWYTPVEMFNILLENDKMGGKMIKSVHFIPSSHRVLRHHFVSLSQAEREAFLLARRNFTSPLHLEGFPIGRQSAILDTLLAWYGYRLAAELRSPRPETRLAKDSALVARLRLPPAPKTLDPVAPLPSPAEKNHPMLTGLGVAHDGAADGWRTRLRWSPFSQESTGDNTLNGDELVVFDTRVGLGGEEHAISLDAFDLIRVRKLKTASAMPEDENPWSWHIRAGWMREEKNSDACIRFGAGRATRLTSSVIAWAMMDASAYSLPPYGRLRPHLGFIVKKDRVNASAYIGLESEDYQGNAETVWWVDLQWLIVKNSTLDISIEQSTFSDGHIFALEWRRYW
jgi:hypothetical protein